MNRSYFTIHDEGSGELLAVGLEEDFRDILMSIDEPKHLPARLLVRFHDAALKAATTHTTPEGVSPEATS